ncbi:hypothetical protein GUJ93_ZPchr0009g191 [Zizania palustris]|uniref:Uncharacterized protein n=1 Tax=Zizania palustris TaxID=103762 RepID=A0A8J5V7R5_ZIZPA|nr:hypothetical protein GUJ93_ZPchr0009g191 [Zizania palustris]
MVEPKPEEEAVPSPWRGWNFSARELEVAEQLVLLSESFGTSACRTATTSSELSPSAPPASRSSSLLSVIATPPAAAPAFLPPQLQATGAVKTVKDEQAPPRAPPRAAPTRYRLITEIYQETKEIKGCNELQGGGRGRRRRGVDEI